MIRPSSVPAIQNRLRFSSIAPALRDRRKDRPANPPNLQEFRPPAPALGFGHSLRVAPLVFSHVPPFENPFASGIRWVALDYEIEKSHPDVLKPFLNLFDEG